MRTKATLFLLVLVAGLGAFAWYFKKWIDEEKIQTARSEVLGPDAVDLDYLEITFRDRPAAVVLERRTAGWELTAPIKWPANFYAVDRLLRLMQLLKRDSSFPAGTLGNRGQKLSDYGLDPPEGVLVFGRRGERNTLEIGKPTDIGNRVYVRRQKGESGDLVYVVSKSLYDALRLPDQDLRSADVFTQPGTEVRSWNVQVAEAGNLRIWLRREGDKWRLDNPVRARADKAAVETLLNKVLDLKVASFVPTANADPTLLGLANPAFRITVDGPGRRETLLLGAPVPEGDRLVYAQREENPPEARPTIFTVSVKDPGNSDAGASILNDLRNIQLGLRDRHVVEFDAARLLTLTLIPAGDPPLTLQRIETGGWQVVSRAGDQGLVTLPGDAGVITRLIEEIAGLQAVETDGFVTDAPLAEALETYGLTGPAWQIRISEKGGDKQGDLRTRTLMLGGASATYPNLRYAKLAEEDSVYLVDRALHDDLSRSPHHYRERQLQKLPEGARITALALRRLNNNDPVLSVALAGPEQTWEQALAAEPEARRSALLGLLTDLRTLRAKNIIAPSFSPTVPDPVEKRAWTWLLEATIALEGGESPQSTVFKLHLDDFKGTGDLVGASIDLGLVFSLEQPFVDAFAALVLARPDPGPPPPGSDKPPGADNTPPAGPSAPAAP
jgi:hypothetical protein